MLRAGCHVSSRFGRSMLCVSLSVQCVVYATAKHASPGRVEAWHPRSTFCLDGSKHGTRLRISVDMS